MRYKRSSCPLGTSVTLDALSGAYQVGLYFIVDCAHSTPAPFTPLILPRRGAIYAFSKHGVFRAYFELARTAPHLYLAHDGMVSSLACAEPEWVTVC